MPETPPAPSGSPSHGKVVAIDDDPVLLTLYEKLLPAGGYQVATIEDPLAGLQQPLPFQPDIILTDLKMPGISGFDLIRKIRDACKDKNIRIIAVSALRRAEDIEEALDAGAHDYLGKPFEPSELLIRLKRQMEQLPATDKPAAPADEKAPAADEKPPPLGPRAVAMGAKVLVIDDDADIRTLVRTLLTAQGHRVLQAEDGEAGLRTAAREEPDLIILDILMPRMDGYEVSRQLAGAPHTAYIPILILSAKGEAEDIALGLTGYADEYVTKPFNTAEFTARVTALLRRTGERTREKREQKWVIRHLAERAQRRGEEVYSIHMDSLPDIPGDWKGPRPDLITRRGRAGTACIIESVNTLHDERTVSRWRALEEVEHLKLRVIGTSPASTALARAIKKENSFRAQVKWIAPRKARAPSLMDKLRALFDSERTSLYIVLIIIALLLTLTLTGQLPGLFSLLDKVNR